MFLNSPFLSTILFITIITPTSVADEFPARFRMQELDPAAGKVVYAVTTADVDGDGDSDAVALTNNRVIWYEQPSWTPHVILQDQTPPDNVCFAAHDIDGDGQVDFAIGAGWTKTGTLHWISRPASGEGLWTVHAIGEETSVHRMRWADVLGTGRPQLVVSPLNASAGSGVRLLAFEIPRAPAVERWPATVLNAQLNRMHNHLHLDFDGAAPIDTITASREGLTLIRRHGDNTDELIFGHSDTPEKFGVEVWWNLDGNGQNWRQQVLDAGGMATEDLTVADLTGDGRPDILAGGRATGNVRLYINQTTR